MQQKEKKEKKTHKKVRETQMFLGTGMRFNLLFYNAIPLIIVEVVYSLLSVSIVAPLFRITIKLLVIISGSGTITSENILQTLFRPLPLISLAVILVCIGFYSLLDISAAIFTFDCSRQKKRVGVIEIIEFSVKNAVRIVQPKNLLILVVVLFLLPIVSLGVSSNFLSSIDMPIFVGDFLKNNVWIAITVCIAFFVMIIVALRWNFAIHYFTIERVDFITAVKKSAKLDRRHRILNLISMLLVQAVLALANIVIIFIGKKLALLIIVAFGTGTVLGAFLLALVVVVFGLAILVIQTLGMPISVLKISANYYVLKESAGEELVPVEFTQRTIMHKFKKATRIIACVLLAISILAITVGFYLFSNSNTDVYESLRGDTLISGYRGGDPNVTENTLKCIEVAAEKSAEDVSIDVQVSKDGQVFLATVPNLSAISKLTGYAADIDYEEIAQAKNNANFSSFLSQGDKPGFPLLSEAIDTARENDIGLIIDVSSIDYRDDAIDLVTNIVLQSGYSERCEIASRHYCDIERVCEIAPAIKTVYIAGIAFGSFDSFDCADAIAVESLAISEDTVSVLRGSGIEVYAWCVPSKSGCEEAAVARVDNIIATDITTAQKALDTMGFSDFGYSVLSSFGPRDSQ